MKNQYTAIIKEQNGFWIGWIKKIPGVNCQEISKEELLSTLKITLTEALEMNAEVFSLKFLIELTSTLLFFPIKPPLISLNY